uniref:Tetratricopeptide repeat protein n=1 Tax=Buteo japonicus TaxID=224669 RepID=A0A8C0BC76_9AVES
MLTSKSLEKNPDDAEYYCQRAYAYILLQKYADAVADAKKSLELNPNNAVALLRKGLGEYHIKNYASALESFREGQRLDSNVGFLAGRGHFFIWEELELFFKT